MTTAHYRENSPGYLPAVDGLRGVLAIGVMLLHIDYYFYPGGVLFMDTFYILSSYLITNLLLKSQHRTGKIRFASFYIRRIKRLFPAMYIMLAVYFCYCLASGITSAPRLMELAYAGLYISSWIRALEIDSMVFQGHTWSLSVEEQFYLLWPLVLAFIFKFLGLGRQAVWGLLLLAVCGTLWRYNLLANGASIERLYNGFDMRIDAFMLGAALAMFRYSNGHTLGLFFSRIANSLVLPCTVLLFIIGGFYADYFDSGYYWYLWTPFLLVSTLLIASLLESGDGWAVSFYKIRPLTWIGEMCYGVYLWHYPVFRVMQVDLKLDVVWVATVGVVLTLAIARLSYVFVEWPILQSRGKPEPLQCASTREQG